MPTQMYSGQNNEQKIWLFSQENISSCGQSVQIHLIVVLKNNQGKKLYDQNNWFLHRSLYAWVHTA